MYFITQVPFYGESGLNAGIMPMNFTRIRQLGQDGDGDWVDINMKIFDKYKSKIKLADQDILNILFNEVIYNFYE